MKISKIKQEAREIYKDKMALFWKGYALIFIISLALETVITKLINVSDYCYYQIDYLNEIFCVIAKSDIISFLGNILSAIIIAPLTYGFIYYLLRIVRKEKVELNDIFKYKNKIFILCVITFTVKILTSFFTILFIIPGIIVTLNYAFVQFVFVDGKKELTVREYLRKSRELIKGHRWNYLLFNLSFLGWILVGIITFGIALIWVLPYYSIAQVLYYENLKSQRK